MAICENVEDNNEQEMRSKRTMPTNSFGSESWRTLQSPPTGIAKGMGYTATPAQQSSNRGMCQWHGQHHLYCSAVLEWRFQLTRSHLLSTNKEVVVHEGHFESLENVRFLCSLHYDTATAMQKRLLKSSVIAALLLAISAALALSTRDAYTVFARHSRLKELITEHEGLTRQKYSSLQIAAEQSGVYVEFQNEAESLGLTNSYDSPSDIAQQWQIPGSSATLNNIVLDRENLNRISQGIGEKTITDFESSVEKAAFGGTRRPFETLKGILDRLELVVPTGDKKVRVVLDQAYGALNDLSTRYPIIGAFQRLRGNPGDAETIRFGDVRPTRLILSSLSSLVESLDLGGPASLVLTRPLEVSRTYKTAALWPANNPSSPKRDLESTTLGTLFEELSRLATFREQLLAVGVPASIYGISFTIPLVPFILVSALASPFVLTGFAAQRQRILRHRDYAIDLEERIHDVVAVPREDYEHVRSLWLIDPRQLSGFWKRLLGIAIDPAMMILILMTSCILAMHVILVVASFQAARHGWLLQWIGVQLHASLSVLLFAATLMLCYLVSVQTIRLLYSEFCSSNQTKNELPGGTPKDSGDIVSVSGASTK